MDVIREGARDLRALIRRRRELRMLNRIAILPTDWDVTGRHCEHV